MSGRDDYRAGADDPAASRLLDEAASAAELEARLAAMAMSSDDAEAFLLELGTALFPEGLPDVSRVTWAERRAASASSATGAMRGDGDRDDGSGANAEARLRAAEARFRTLVEQIPAVTFMAVLGEGANEIYVSPHIEALLGFTQTEWLENPFLWYYQLHPEDRALWHTEFARGCRTGGPFRAECRFLARDGRVVWVHGEARLVRDELGRPMFLQGVAFDITEARRAQEVLLRDAVRTARAEEETAIAHRVQASVLPRNLRVPGLEIAATMQSAEDVGGDYFDVLPAQDGCWIAVGDVSGHGLSAGLVMLMLQSAMGALVRSRPYAGPSQLVALVNEVLHDNIRVRLAQDEHVTFTLLRYYRDGRVLYAGAHEDMLVCRRRTGVVENVASSGAWLGAKADIRRVTVDRSVRLADGDLVVLYTDGVTEAMNAQREMFGIERLRNAIAASRDAPATQVRDAILAAVRAWMSAQADDLTVLAFRYVAPSPPSR